MKQIEIKNLSMRIKRKSILDDINLNIKESECVAILGQNGAGKTTLVNTILGLCHTKKGVVKNDFSELPSYKIGVHMQESSLNGLMTVKEVLNLFLFEGENTELIRKFDLESKLNQRVSTLSGGEKQKLQLIVMLQNNPEVIFIDEITTGLDASSREKIIQHIDDEIRKKKKTLIMVTHYFEEVEILADRVIFMRQGKIVEDGLIKELYKKYGIHKEIHLELVDTNKVNEFEDIKVVDNTALIPIFNRGDMIKVLNYIAENDKNVINYTIHEPQMIDLYNTIMEKGDNE